MKTNRFYSHVSALAVLTACLLWAAPLQAQTFRGQENLTDSPKGLEVLIYPVLNRPSTIRVNFNNLMGGSVRVIIRDEKGAAVYDEYEATPRYRGYLDLSSLPAGSYTVSLSNRYQQYAQTLTIEPPIASRITMRNGENPDLSVKKELIVSQ